MINFQLPEILNPGNNDWVPIDVSDFVTLEVTEERLWFGYFLIPYPNAFDGWVLRSTTSELLRLSISAETDTGDPVHIWGDFPVNDTIAYP